MDGIEEELAVAEEKRARQRNERISHALATLERLGQKFLRGELGAAELAEACVITAAEECNKQTCAACAAGDMREVRVRQQIAEYLDHLGGPHYTTVADLVRQKSDEAWWQNRRPR
jgi:hypothetical protein